MWISLLFIFLWVTVCSLRGFIHCLSTWLPNFSYKVDFLISDCRLSLILHWYNLHVYIGYLQAVSRACHTVSPMGTPYLPSLGLHRFHPQPCNSSMFLYHSIPIYIWLPHGGLPWPILLDGTYLCCILPQTYPLLCYPYEIIHGLHPYYHSPFTIWYCAAFPSTMNVIWK